MGVDGDLARVVFIDLQVRIPNTSAQNSQTHQSLSCFKSRNFTKVLRGL